jgi:hypothetical protein
MERCQGVGQKHWYKISATMATLELSLEPFSVSYAAVPTVYRLAKTTKGGLV